MAKKITLNDLAAQMQKGFASVDKKFMALADDIADIKHAMATKEHIIALRTQVNSTEAQLKRANIEIRLAVLDPREPIRNLVGRHNLPMFSKSKMSALLMRALRRAMLRACAPSFPPYF